jgi:hypothetical protein
MQAGDMHDENSGLNRLPTVILLAQSIENPEQEPYGKVAIIRKMTDKIAASDMVGDMQEIMTHEEVVT